MGESRSDPKTRKLAAMLSALALTPDGALGSYRDRRAADSELDPQDLKCARDILDAIGHAILDRDRDRWRRVRDASKLLERDAARVPAEEESGPGENVLQGLAALPFRKAVPEDPRGVPSLIGDDERDGSGQTQHLRTPFRKGKVLPFDRTEEELPALETPAASAPPAPAPQAAVAAPPPQPGYGPSRSDTSLVQLTLEQYAAFCAERTVYPERIADTVARYQLRDEVQAQVLDEIWRARFVDDPALGERYAATYEHYRHWLRKQGR